MTDRPEIKFKPSAPKPAENVTLGQFRKLISAHNKPEAVKDIGGGTVKVFMSGPTNYYLAGNRALHKLLSTFGIE